MEQAFYGCFVGALLIWRPIMRNGADKKKIILASILGCVLTLQMGAFSVTVETMLSGVTELPFTVFLAAMQPIHLAIGFVEGLITAAVLCFIYEARPEMLWGVENAAPREAKLSYGKTFTILGILAAVVGGVLSLFGLNISWSRRRAPCSALLNRFPNASPRTVRAPLNAYGSPSILALAECMRYG